MGIPVKLVFSLIWAISAGVATIAGVLLAPISLIDANLGFIGLKAFAAVVLGGLGSIPRALVGGLTIGLIEMFSGAYGHQAAVRRSAVPHFLDQSAMADLLT
jgi:branched-chain amino acid transport system permease protein